jgi:hypothetical protein
MLYVFGGGYLSLYKGLVMGTWREGSYTEDSKRHVLEALEMGHFFLQGLHK